MMTCPTANYSDHVTNIESEVDNAGYTPEVLVIMHTALSGDKHVMVEGPWYKRAIGMSRRTTIVSTASHTCVELLKHVICPDDVAKVLQCGNTPHLKVH